jgi:tRNA nucleotidyltransferase (CCA-adding enzyme)
MSKNSVRKEVLSKIVPSKVERLKVLKSVKSFLDSVNKSLKKNKISAKAVLGGSYAKDTWLSGDYDVDVFVKFHLKYKGQSISDLLEKALKPFKFERLHGSRDYFWVRDDVKYELVPVLDIKKAKDAVNVTDFSPLHVAWVNKKGKKFKDDIRLVKKFCKASKCYGAESYIRGFSGHVVDILTIYYGGFERLIKAATKWSPKVVLDYNNALKGKALLVLNTSKTEGPLVLVDPVQPNRNAAAALTEENFDRFISAAKSYLKKPSLDCFEEKEVDFAKLRKKGHVVKVGVLSLIDKEDIAGTKFVRAFEFIRDRLSDFVVKDSGWSWNRNDEGQWWFLLGVRELPKVMDWMGPPLKIEPAVKEFRRRYSKTFVKDGRVWAKINREETRPEHVVKNLLKDDYVKSRVKKAWTTG